MRLLCALLLVLPSAASAQWQLVSETKAVALKSGAWQVTKSVVGPADARKKAGKPVVLSLVFWKNSKCEIVVTGQGTLKGALKIDELARRAKAVAACNGGYFDPGKFSPSGLQIAAGAREGAFLKGMPFGGGLMVRVGKPSLYVDAEFEDQSDITQMLQCCPMLVDGGVAMTEARGGPEARRTFLLTDGGEIWAMGVAGAIGLKDLALVLSNPDIISECKVTRALNLDGGPSTGLWYQGLDGIEQHSPAMWRVKNIVCILPRS